MFGVLLIVLPVLFFVVRRIIHWLRNYITACSYGLPIILLPVSFQDAWWLPLRPLFSFLPSLPFGLGTWYLYTTSGWPAEDGNHSLLRYGENFILCSPRSNVIVTAEQEVVEAVFGSKHGRGWRMSEEQGELFTVYGMNVASANGEVWKRHRRITSSAFGESTMRSVWEEAWGRAGGLTLNGDEDEEEESGMTLKKVRSKFDLLAMQILTVVGFGQETDLTGVPPGHKESLMDSLGFILQHILLTLIFHSLKAPDLVLPKVLRRLKVSVEELRMYMRESVLRHMQSARAATEGGSSTTSLLGAMIKANELGKLEQKTGAPKSYLSDSELYGNIFVFNVAGYETTASSFTFALSYLAAHPDVQDWVVEEVDRVHQQRDTIMAPEYVETFPKFVRCLAVMHETLRLASPAPMLVRSPITPSALQITTPTGLRTVTVNPDTIVGFNDYGAHLSPRWGPNASSFDPRRFIQTTYSGEENVVVPEAPLYAPFMMGPRVCPGKKFAQVEFVAVLARVLVDWRVEVATQKGESEAGARQRLMRVVGDKCFNISAHVKRPTDAGVRFTRRREQARGGI